MGLPRRPVSQSGTTLPLVADMVITIEPAAVLDDGLYCAEQVVRVGEPPEVLSDFPTALVAI